MNGGTPNRTRVVADVGGTNTRLAVFDPRSGELSEVGSYLNHDYGALEEVIAAWLKQLRQEQPRDFCIAVAAPPAGDRVTMVNLDWAFSCRDLAQQFGFQRIRWLNDFQANAHALPHLGAGNTLAIAEGGEGAEGGKLAVVGPGTGLGGATLQWVEGIPIASASEPGHMGLAPATELELEIMRRLLPQRGEVHAEYLVSGPGLVRLYKVIADIRGQAAEELSPAQISGRALAGSDPGCRQALSSFCELLGSVCGDFVLARGAYGGLFLAGGILPGIVDFLQASDFLRRFRCKGAMESHLAQIPVRLITLPNPGLLGAAHAPIRD